MLLARAFSATSRRAQQSLFEEYVRPLNEKAKSNLRKKTLRRAPKFHGRMKKDTAFLLKAFERLSEEREQDRQILAQLQGLIKKHAGPRFDVVDISMHNWAVALHDAPLDFAIVDREYPNGLPPGTPTGNLPIAYDPSTLARILASEGYAGSFWSPPPNGMQQKLPSLPRNQNPIPVHQELSSPWPEYCPSPYPRHSNQLVHPARLVTNYPTTFSLTLPGPTIIPLSRYLRANFSLGSAGRDLLGVFWLWMQSLGINPLEVGPTCLGLIIVVFMQQKYRFPNIVDPKHIPDAHRAHDTTWKVWVPYRYHVLPFGEALDLRGENESLGRAQNTKQQDKPETLKDASSKPVFEVVPVQLGVSFVEQFPRLIEDKKISAMLHSFLDYLATSDSWYRDFVISPGKGGRIPRHQPEVANLHRYVAFEESKHKSQSLGWAGDVLVVQDPFLSTYNHAEGLSKTTHRYLYLHCHDARKVMERGHPFVTIFGKELRSPKSKLFNIQSSKPMSVGQNISRAYHSDGTHIEMDINAVPAPVLAARSVTIKRVREAVRHMYGVKYDVQAFGSTQYGVSTATSDLDLVVIDPDRPTGFTPDVNLRQLPSVYDIQKLGRTMRQFGFIRIVSIPKAKVPIVKLVDPTTRLECDINVNDQLGLINTSMIKRYCDLVPVLRPMLGYVKRWAKPLGLNSPSTGQGPPTFSTYAFALMVIGYLQLRGWAPNLQHEIESSSEGGEEGVFWLRESVSPQARRIRCDTRYHRKKDWNPDIEIELKEALHGWFTFWSEGFDYEGSMMDIKSGGVVPRPTKQPKMLTSEGSQRSTKTVLVLNPDLPYVAADDLSEHNDTELAEISSEREEAEAIVDFEGREEEEDQEDRDSTNLEVEESTMSTFAKESISICIIDPFVRTKNVTRSITKKNLELFRSNCQRVAILMSCGASISEVIDLEDDPVFQPQSFAKKRKFVRQPLYPRAERPDLKPRPPPQSEMDAQVSRENVTTERSRLFDELIRPLLPDGKSSTRDKGKDREQAPSDDHAGNIGVAFSQPPPRLQPTAGSSSHSIAATRSNFNKETRKRAWTERQVRTEEGKQRGSADNVDLTAVKKVMSNETPTLADARKGQPAEVSSPLKMTSGSTSLPSKKSKNHRSKRGKRGEGQGEMSKSAEEAAPIPGHLGSKGSPAKFDKDIHAPQEHYVSADDPQKGTGDLPISAIQLRLKKDIRGQEHQSLQRPLGKGKGDVGEGSRSSKAPKLEKS